MRRPLLVLPAVLALVLTGACGGGDDAASGTPSAASGGDAPLADLLPQDVRDAGVLKVGSDLAYAPVDFYAADGKTPTGIDPDLGAALSDQLGVELQFENATFDGLITSLRSDRIDLIMSAMSDTAERQQQVDFVDYFKAGTSILVKKGNPEGVTTLDDLCGKTVALQRGTTQEEVATKQKAVCDGKGAPLDVLAFDRDTEALLQVKQGRAAADLNDFPVAAYNAQTSGGGNDFEVVGDQIEAGPYGIAVRKEDTQLRDALVKALDAIIENGEYAKVLEKYDVTQGAVESAVVNGG